MCKEPLHYSLVKPLLTAGLGDQYIPEQVDFVIGKTLTDIKREAIKFYCFEDYSPYEAKIEQECIALIQVAHFLEVPSILMDVYVRLWVCAKMGFDRWKLSLETILEQAEKASIPLAIIDDFIVKHWAFNREIIWKEASVADLMALDTISSKFQIDFGQPTLYLSDKSLTSLDGIDQLPIRHTLQRLFLNNNNLSVICPTHFHEFTQLRYLSFENNRLADIDFACFQTLLHLKVLDVCQNKLTYIDPIPLQELPCLEYFLFERNELTQENKEIIQEALPRVKTEF